MYSVGHLVRVPAAAVATERTAQGGREAKEERNECAENEPVGVAPVCGEATVTSTVAGNTEEHHLDDPYHERDQECESADERHEDGTRAVVGRAAKPEENRDSGETSG